MEDLRVERVAALAEEDPLCEFPERHDPTEYIGGDRESSGRYNRRG
jgi:hypothetical protein